MNLQHIYIQPSQSASCRNLWLMPTQEITVGIGSDLEVSFRPVLGTISKIPPKSSPNFSFVPMDGDFGVNRTYPGFAGLGDISLRVRPSAHQSITLPPVPYLQEFPIYTSLSTANADIGTHVLKLLVSLSSATMSMPIPCHPELSTFPTQSQLSWTCQRNLGRLQHMTSQPSLACPSMPKCSLSGAVHRTQWCPCEEGHTFETCADQV